MKFKLIILAVVVIALLAIPGALPYVTEKAQGLYSMIRPADTEFTTGYVIGKSAEGNNCRIETDGNDRNVKCELPVVFKLKLVNFDEASPRYQWFDVPQVAMQTEYGAYCDVVKGQCNQPKSPVPGIVIQ